MKALHEYMKYKKTYLVNDQSLSNTNNVHNEAYELQKKKKKKGICMKHHLNAVLSMVIKHIPNYTA